LTIRLNGETHEVVDPITISALLAGLGIDPRLVAVEHNLRIVKREEYAETRLSAGDEVEIVKMVGGG
jgi:thiamine biosynthesis protein ThiS